MSTRSRTALAGPWLAWCCRDALPTARGRYHAVAGGVRVVPPLMSYPGGVVVSHPLVTRVVWVILVILANIALRCLGSTWMAR